MKFKIDENSPFSVKRILELRGDHQVDNVFHEGITGSADKDLLRICLTEQRILITLDTDFNNAILHPKGSFYGVIFHLRNIYIIIKLTLIDHTFLFSFV